MKTVVCGWREHAEEETDGAGGPQEPAPGVSGGGAGPGAGRDRSPQGTEAPGLGASLPAALCTRGSTSEASAERGGRNQEQVWGDHHCSEKDARLRRLPKCPAVWRATGERATELEGRLLVALFLPATVHCSGSGAHRCPQVTKRLQQLPTGLCSGHGAIPEGAAGAHCLSLGSHAPPPHSKPGHHLSLNEGQRTTTECCRYKSKPWAAAFTSDEGRGLTQPWGSTRGSGLLGQGLAGAVHIMSPSRRMKERIPSASKEAASRRRDTACEPWNTGSGGSAPPSR